MLSDLCVRVDAHDQNVAEGSRLTQSIGVAVVHHVEAAVREDTHGLLALLLWRPHRRRLGVRGPLTSLHSSAHSLSLTHTLSYLQRGIQLVSLSLLSVIVCSQFVSLTVR